MRLSFIGILGIFALTGCVTTASQSQLNTAMQKANEASGICPIASMPNEVSLAWEKVGKQDEKQCPRGTPSKPLPPSQSMTRHECHTKLIREYVKPVSTKPKSLEKLISQMKSIASAYGNDEIDRDTANSRSEIYWMEYAVSEGSHYKFYQCQNAAFQQYVMPIYHNKAELAGFMAQKSEIGLKVDQGKLTPQQADIEVQKAMAQFIGAEDKANAAINAQNAQAWREYGANMRQVSQQLMQAEAAQQKAQQGGAIKNTNCQFIANQMQCTSW